jgi:hypothetical protein
VGHPFLYWSLSNRAGPLRCHRVGALGARRQLGSRLGSRRAGSGFYRYVGGVQRLAAVGAARVYAGQVAAGAMSM